MRAAASRTGNSAFGSARAEDQLELVGSDGVGGAGTGENLGETSAVSLKCGAERRKGCWREGNSRARTFVRGEMVCIAAASHAC
jgi:hypothetical protein